MVRIWDEAKKQFLFEVEFNQEVVSVQLTRDAIICVLINRIVIYSFERSPRLLHSFNTVESYSGLCSAVQSTNNLIVAAQTTQVGQIQVLQVITQDQNLIGGQNTRNVAVIQAHTSRLQNIQLSADGNLIATASIKGTLIRVFDITAGQLIQTFRRGTEHATIYNLVWTADSRFLACCSDTGSIHVFKLAAVQSDAASSAQYRPSQQHLDNTAQISDSLKASPSQINPMLPAYFQPERSFARCSISLTSARFKIQFGDSEKSLVAITENGEYFKFAFDPSEGGTCTLVEKTRLEAL
ncbi:hypothetical protein MIR68_012031 [Amoeboaphelidium protococcarum]|nr:hypothetical protein MIR68_012031 [Amoeboaphelidium protococcarum]